MTSDIRAVILCGGKGTRLRPYTTVLPKPLMPLGDRPILEIVIKQLKQSGIKKITLCVGHLAELIRAFFGDGEKLGVEISYAMEEKPLGTVGPLAYVDDLGENFIVMNGDILTDLDPNQLIDLHLKNEAELTIATHERTHQIDFGVLETDQNTGRINKFIEKPTRNYEVSMGIYLMNRSVLNTFKPGDYFGFDHLVLSLLDNERAIQRHLHRGYWLDIGRIDDYEKAQNDPRWNNEEIES